jgi:glutamyl-Q tRNA(Asp) synthetase
MPWVVLGENGKKLSKQNGAQALDVSEPLSALNAAAATLGLPVATTANIQEALQAWIDQTTLT